MKFTITALAFTAAILFTAFTKGEHGIPGCYTSFKAEGLKTQPAVELTEAEKAISLATPAGNTTITVANGYTVAYNNKNKAAVVSLKVIQANAAAYAKDTATALASLRYLNNDDADGKGVITLSYNGYKIYGTSHNAPAGNGIRGSFVMFPAKNIIVYITFNNVAGGTETIEDYNSRRNAFLGAYTAHIQNRRQ